MWKKYIEAVVWRRVWQASCVAVVVCVCERVCASCRVRARECARHVVRSYRV
jgi:hypothetical protein